jgi:hypothetical protein
MFSSAVYDTTLDWLAIEEGNAFEADVVRGKFARMHEMPQDDGSRRVSG